MMTSLLRQRSGTKVMPVSQNLHPVSRFTRRPNRLSGIGAAAALLTQPGPNGGTQIVDASGDVIYTADQVAANPSLLSSLAASSPCPGGMLPTWFPGGESTCADQSPGAIGPEGNTVGPQFNYAIGGSCADITDGWCMTGSDPTNPASYTWQGGGTPTTLNPAVINSAQPLPSAYTTQETAATQLAIQDALSTPFGSGATAQQSQNAIAALTNTPTPTVTPTTTTVLNPPQAAGPATGVTAQSIANASPQSGNTNLNVGAGASNGSGSGSGSTSTSSGTDDITTLENQLESATGLSGTTLLLIAAGVVALMVLKK